jgi:beta-phosphoglucomutase-like phosphatase (HAD superfamily)
MLADGHILLRPGIKQLIPDAGAGSIQLAIATNTSPENIAALLEVGLGKDWQSYSLRHRIWSHCAAQKPPLDMYYCALNDLGFAPDDCIARSGLAAGIKTYITVNHYTRNKDFSEVAAVFGNLGDLDALYKAAGLPLAR